MLSLILVFQKLSLKSFTKMTFWRAAGLTYVNYSSIAARCVRNALKPGVDVCEDSLLLFAF